MAVAADSIEELNKRFLNFIRSAEDVDEATEEIYEDLLDEVLLEFVFDCHRSVKLGSAEAEEGIEDAHDFQIVDEPGLDVFGEPLVRKTGKCVCPNCQHRVSANRFATHLERCLGMGRSCSRASRRAATNSSSSKVQNSYSDDDENDADWGQKKKRKRKSTKKQTKKRSVKPKADSDDVSTSNSPPDVLS